MIAVNIKAFLIHEATLAANVKAFAATTYTFITNA
jgi:hypothetical protein